jgi:hypothetical protein
MRVLGVTALDELAETTIGKEISLPGFRQQCASWNKSDQLKDLSHKSVARSPLSIGRIFLLNFVRGHPLYLFKAVT